MAPGAVGGGFHRFLESTAVAAAAGLLAILALRIASSVSDPLSALACVCAFALGFGAADFVSGLVHWGFDRFFREDTPYLGPHFVRPFREHHRDPRGIVAHDFIELNGNTCIAALPVLAGTVWVVPDAAGPGVLFAATFVGSLAGWTIATNQLHQWAHHPSPPRAVRVLQRRGWVLAPDHHAQHHHAPFDRRYCITSGLLNPFLDRVGLFPALESLLRSTRSRQRIGVE